MYLAPPNIFKSRLEAFLEDTLWLYTSYEIYTEIGGNAEVL